LLVVHGDGVSASGQVGEGNRSRGAGGGSLRRGAGASALRGDGDRHQGVESLPSVLLVITVAVIIGRDSDGTESRNQDSDLSEIEIQIGNNLRVEDNFDGVDAGQRASSAQLTNGDGLSLEVSGRSSGVGDGSTTDRRRRGIQMNGVLGGVVVVGNRQGDASGSAQVQSQTGAEAQ